MPCNAKMGNGVRGFPVYMGWSTGVGMRGSDGEGGSLDVFLIGNT